MKDHTRRAVAYIAAIESGRRAATLFDYSEGRYFNFGGTFHANGLNVFDYESRCYISGTARSLFHYGNGRHITFNQEPQHFNPDRQQFSGFDYDTGSHFSGTVAGSQITLYDYENGRYYSYAA
jgi:hypothetical protein